MSAVAVLVAQRPLTSGLVVLTSYLGGGGPVPGPVGAPGDGRQYLASAGLCDEGPLQQRRCC
jgi:hypothetical protein